MSLENPKEEIKLNQQQLESLRERVVNLINENKRKQDKSYTGQAPETVLGEKAALDFVSKLLTEIQMQIAIGSSSNINVQEAIKLKIEILMLERARDYRKRKTLRPNNNPNSERFKEDMITYLSNMETLKTENYNKSGQIQKLKEILEFIEIDILKIKKPKLTREEFTRQYLARKREEELDS